MSRSKRMKIIVDLAEEEMNLAMATLKEVSNKRDYIQHQLDDLVNYMNEYVQQLTTKGNAFMPIQLQTTQAFIEKLKQAIGSQQQQLASMDDVVNMARNQWLEKRVRFNALQKVHEKLKHNEERLLDKAEQRMLDDLAAQNFLK